MLPGLHCVRWIINKTPPQAALGLSRNDRPTSVQHAGWLLGAPCVLRGFGFLARLTHASALPPPTRASPSPNRLRFLSLSFSLTGFAVVTVINPVGRNCKTNLAAITPMRRNSIMVKGNWRRRPFFYVPDKTWGT